MVPEKRGNFYLGKRPKNPREKKLKKGYSGVIQGLFRAIQGYSGAIQGRIQGRVEIVLGGRILGKGEKSTSKIEKGSFFS